jgi:glycosyltransferase involved in cell wall biosynthesis
MTAPTSGPAARAAGRVLLVVGDATGGIGVHVSDLARALPGHGWRVTVLTSVLTASRFDLGPDVRTPLQDRGPAGLGGCLRRLRQLAAGQELVHAHGHHAGLACAVALATLPARHRPPLVVSWHNAVLASGYRAWPAAAAEWLQARRADLVTGASWDLVARARHLGAAAELAEVAAPAAAPWPGDRGAARRELATELGLGAGPVVLTVSRIAPQKNLDVLVDAASNAGPATWLLVGDGRADLLAELRARAHHRGAAVRFLGARRDVPRLMAAADVFALPSRWEARALVVQEAMAAGLPVVASAVGGLPDLLAGAGLLVPAGDPVALRAAVDRLLADPAAAADLAERGRRRYAELATSADVARAWADRYRRLTARH